VAKFRISDGITPREHDTYCGYKNLAIFEMICGYCGIHNRIKKSQV